MDEADRLKITSNVTELVKLIKFYDIDQLLVERGVFTKLIMDDIKTGVNESDRIINLLQELTKRGPYAFQRFFEILKETHNFQAALLLKPDDVGLSLAFIKDNQQSRGSTKNGDQNDTNMLNTNIPHISPGHTVQAEPATRSEEITQCGVNFRVGTNVYRMDKPERGICLIINNIEFEGGNDMRNGSEIDAVRLEQVFMSLHFRVYLRTNLTAKAMIEQLKRVADFDHTEANALIVIILSHGNENGVLGTDSVAVPVTTIYMMFNNLMCPTLKKKPKLFFIQACRGVLFDHGTPESVEADAKISHDREPHQPNFEYVPPDLRIPQVTDICIQYSTVEGYVSNRNPVLGTWFVRSLVKKLIDHAHTHELIQILRLVDSEVQEKTGIHGEKQATDIRQIGFNTEFYFNPGYFLQ